MNIMSFMKTKLLCWSDIQRNEWNGRGLSENGLPVWPLPAL